MALERVDIDLYIYTGTSGNYTNGDKKYTLTKERLSDDSNIIVEIAQLVRDYIDLDFNNDYLSTTVWVSAAVTFIDADTGQAYESNGTQVFTYLAFDGFGYYEEEINPTLSDNALYTSNYMYLPEGTSGKFPIFAEGVGKVNIGGVDTQITDNGNSNQKIQYVTVADSAGSVKIYDTDDTTLLKTVTVKSICEPKYTPYKVTFVNKFGAYQDIHFFKKTVETFNAEDEVYKRNNINTSTVTYATNEGQRQRYNVNAVTSLSANTGFVNEDFTSAIEEMFLAENVWIRFDSKTLPVIPKSKSFVQKSSVNDKLINYTVDFEFAFNKINNVR